MTVVEFSTPDRTPIVQTRKATRNQEAIMELQLTIEEADAMRVLLDTTISDMSPEIADTDNAAYRLMLRQRRDLLNGIRDRIGLSRTLS